MYLGIGRESNMKTLVINMMPYELEDRVLKIMGDYKKNNPESDIKRVDLNESSDLKSCIGCWSCWLKTPGRCVHKDSIELLYGDYVNSDHIVMLFGTKNGFIDSVGKLLLDRTIPHYHPYIIVEDGECHHVRRYESYPEWHVYYPTDQLTTEEEQVIEDYLSRTAYHFRSDCFRIDDNYRTKKLVDPLPQNYESLKRKGQKIENIAIYNGSPRGKTSNSKILIEKIIEGIKTNPDVDVDTKYLVDVKNHDEYLNDMDKYDTHIFVLPLYVHAMPSIVMKLIERIDQEKLKGKNIGFIVQSGFPEASQSYYLRAYFGLLSTRLGANYLGTAIRGGVEGMSMKPDNANKKLFAEFINLGKGLATTGGFDDEVVATMGKLDKLPIGLIILFKLLKPTGMINFYWNMSLKKNNAFDRRFDKPYLKV